MSSSRSIVDQISDDTENRPSVGREEGTVDLLNEAPQKAIDILITQASVFAAYGDYRTAIKNLDEAKQLLREGQPPRPR